MWWLGEEEKPVEEWSSLWSIWLGHLTSSLDAYSEEKTFMPPELLQSQFDTLETPSAPENFIQINVDKNLSRDNCHNYGNSLKWNENRLYQWIKTHRVFSCLIPNHVLSRFFLRWINHNVLRYYSGGFWGIWETFIIMLVAHSEKWSGNFEMKLHLSLNSCDPIKWSEELL